MTREKLIELDLTDPATAKLWKYDEALTFEKAQPVGIKETDLYKKSIAIGDEARTQGYNAILYESMRGEGTNFVIISKSKDFINSILQPKMVIPIE
jgi:hypothetical protein